MSFVQLRAPASELGTLTLWTRAHVVPVATSFLYSGGVAPGAGLDDRAPLVAVGAGGDLPHRDLLLVAAGHHRLREVHVADGTFHVIGWASSPNARTCARWDTGLNLNHDLE